MWDLISFILALGVFLLVVHYWLNPAEVIRDIKTLVGSNSRVSKLEKRVAELEKIVMESQSIEQTNQ